MILKKQVDKIRFILSRSVGRNNYIFVENVERSEVKRHQEVFQREFDSINDPQWKAVLELHDVFMAKILDAMAEFFGDDLDQIMQCAWEEYFVFEDDCPELDQAQPEFDSSFIGWFAYNWKCTKESVGSTIPLLPDEIPAKYLLNREGDRLTSEEKGFIIANLQSDFSYYILRSTNGIELTFTDLLRGGDIIVKDFIGSRLLQKGTILMSRIMTFQGVTVFASTHPYPQEPMAQTLINSFKKSILEMIDGTEFTDELLSQFGVEIRACFFEMLEGMNLADDNFVNNDGDPIKI